MKLSTFFLRAVLSFSLNIIASEGIDQMDSQRVPDLYSPSSIIFNLANAALESKVISSNCRQTLILINEGIKLEKLWAIKRERIISLEVVQFGIIFC